MEFKEFTNPLEKDYDIKFNSVDAYNTPMENPYVEQLLILVGVLEDINEVELYNKYGITINEYFNPTKETIDKVINKLEQLTDVEKKVM